jgi:nucleoside phosphorylase
VDPVAKPSRGPALVCFAVKEEAAAFNKLARAHPEVEILLTGMGKRNAENAVQSSIAKNRPRVVLSCGFAGGLNPELETGTVVHTTDPETDLEPALVAAGSKRVVFHCAARVAATTAEKRSLRQSTGADVVEMESQWICSVCRGFSIPCATVRVILDTAEEDLPLDFNQLMTPEMEIDGAKLALALAKSPGKIPALMRLRKQTQAAAEKLAAVLEKVLAVRLSS